MPSVTGMSGAARAVTADTIATSLLEVQDAARSYGSLEKSGWANPIAATRRLGALRTMSGGLNDAARGMRTLGFDRHADGLELVRDTVNAARSIERSLIANGPRISRPLGRKLDQPFTAAVSELRSRQILTPHEASLLDSGIYVSTTGDYESSRIHAELLRDSVSSGVDAYVRQLVPALADMESTLTGNASRPVSLMEHRARAGAAQQLLAELAPDSVAAHKATTLVQELDREVEHVPQAVRAGVPQSTFEIPRDAAELRTWASDMELQSRRLRDSYVNSNVAVSSSGLQEKLLRLSGEENARNASAIHDDVAAAIDATEHAQTSLELSLERVSTALEESDMVPGSIGELDVASVIDSVNELRQLRVRIDTGITELQRIASLRTPTS